MRITQVTYKRLVSVERFGNVSVEATGTLDAGEDRDEGFDELRRWVDLQVMTRKHSIEGRLGNDDDDEQEPGGYAPALAVSGSALPNKLYMQASPISGQQVIGSTGQVLAQARGISVGSTQPSGPGSNPARASPAHMVLVPPAGGRREVKLDSFGDPKLTLYDAHGTQVGPAHRLEPETARTMMFDSGIGELVLLPSGEVAYTPSNFLRQQQGMGWLQVSPGPPGSGCDLLEYRDWPGGMRARRVIAQGWADEALRRGLLVRRQGAPGMQFGVSEGAFWAAAPPSPMDDATDEQGEADKADDEDEPEPITKACAACEGIGNTRYHKVCPICQGRGWVDIAEIAAD